MNPGEAYDALTQRQQAMVENDDILKEAVDLAAAMSADEKILAIGEVTKDSKAAIEEARTAYERLTPEQKKLLKQEELLMRFISRYEEIVEEGETGGETGGESGSETGGEAGGETGSETGGGTGGETGSETGGETGGGTGSEPGSTGDDVSGENDMEPDNAPKQSEVRSPGTGDLERAGIALLVILMASGAVIAVSWRKKEDEM